MQTKAIILRKQVTREYDQHIICYTQEVGKLTAVAKSSLKGTSTQGRHLDVLNLVSFDVINGRSVPIITGAQNEDTFPHVRSSLPHLAVAYFFLEVIDRIAYEHQKDDRLWNFLSSTLRELDWVDRPMLMEFFREKQTDFLHTLGYALEKPVVAVANDELLNLDSTFEYTFNTHFHSLELLYQVT